MEFVRMKSFLVLIAILGLQCCALFGQQNQQQSLDAMRNFPAYQEAVLKVYQGYESGLSTHCPKIDLDMATRHAKVYAPIQIDAEGHITNGVWVERANGVACGEKRHYSALVIFKEGKPELYSLLPGDSYATPLLQHDAMLQVASAVAAAGAGTSCSPDVIDTALPNGEPAHEGLPWDEKWTVRGCGKLYLLTLHFVPDSTGTGINISPKETVNLPSKTSNR
jgi:hypothetical protein